MMVVCFMIGFMPFGRDDVSHCQLVVVTGGCFVTYARLDACELGRLRTSYGVAPCQHGGDKIGAHSV